MDPGVEVTSSYLSFFSTGTAEESAQDFPERVELTILMPCLNEAETIVQCVRKARDFIVRRQVTAEILVADNGSTDGSPDLALTAGARVVNVGEKGYGCALRGGIHAARGKYIIMADADNSYDFSNLDALLESLRSGDQLVVGHRFRGGIQPGAMPLLHRYLGNPVLSFLGRLFFSAKIGDFHCGLRGVERRAAINLGLRSAGMEFASEMIVRATLAGLSIGEVPTTLAPAGRSRAPHLRSWRDGWRHLRLLLLLTPRWLMLYPGLSLLLGGTAIEASILYGPVVIGGVGFSIHTMLYAAGAAILGLQLLLFAILARGIGVVQGVLPMSAKLKRFYAGLTLERGVVLGSLLCLLGLMLAIMSVHKWAAIHMGALDPTKMMRLAIPSVTMMIAGGEITFASFLLGMLDLGGVPGPKLTSEHPAQK